MAAESPIKMLCREHNDHLVLWRAEGIPANTFIIEQLLGDVGPGICWAFLPESPFCIVYI